MSRYNASTTVWSSSTSLKISSAQKIFMQHYNSEKEKESESPTPLSRTSSPRANCIKATRLSIFARLPTVARIRTHSATNSPAGEYENDDRETNKKTRGINLHRFSSLAGATKPHLRTENMTRVENTNVPNPTETYRGCFRPRLVSRCRVRPCLTTTILCGCFLKGKRNVLHFTP